VELVIVITGLDQTDSNLLNNVDLATAEVQANSVSPSPGTAGDPGTIQKSTERLPSVRDLHPSKPSGPDVPNGEGALPGRIIQDEGVGGEEGHSG
jgi:hypothetical protein